MRSTSSMDVPELARKGVEFSFSDSFHNDFHRL
jgi:hypothetical protein